MILSLQDSSTQAFFKEVDPSRSGLGLFQHLNDVCYFVKDREGRFVASNEALILLLGYHRESDILGKTDFELVPSYLADNYLKDDQQVLLQGEEVVNKVELVTHNNLSVYWYTTTKVPVFDRDGNIIGLEGVTREFKAASSALGPYPELFKVIDFVEASYSEKVSVADMAQRAGLSVRTFERQFKKRFNLSPIAYLKKVRINAACRDLIHTNHTIARIALDCGFCDQSYMTKEFARLMRITPQVYRDTHVS
jgi:PAS domain S-box-containing protein